VDKSILAMTLANIVARMERSEIRDSRDAGPGLRFAPSGLQPLTIRPAQVICPSGSFLTGLSSLTSDFPKNIVPTSPGIRHPHALFWARDKRKTSGASRREIANVCLMDKSTPHSQSSSPANGSAEWPPDDRLRWAIQYSEAPVMNRKAAVYWILRFRGV
jgi:hypothetical protein